MTAATWAIAKLVAGLIGLICLAFIETAWRDRFHQPKRNAP